MQKLTAYLAANFLLTLVIQFPTQAAQLVGRAILRADTFAPGPTSGQFLRGNTNHRTLPFPNAQPVQGFSGAIAGPRNGTFLVTADNGFGSKGNSGDFGLRIYGLEPDFTTGKVFPVDVRTGERLPYFNRRSFLELNDRNNQAGFPIVAEQKVYADSSIPVNAVVKTQRLLTGGDFDPESIRRSRDGTFWLGDEFGPFLLHVGGDGQLLEAPIPLPNLAGVGQGKLIQSPDNPALANLPDGNAQVANLGGSRGFEGMALNPSGTKLYAMLEGAIVGDTQRTRLLINEFDLTKKQYTGNFFAYRLENPNYAIGDLTAINDNEFIVIERDNNQGDPNNPAFTTPAAFKRLYKININKLDGAGFVEKQLLVDLLNIDDPRGIGGNATKNGKFTFPFVTIENVLPLDERSLLVINDNNYPLSVGRTPGQPDNTEFIKIRLEQPLVVERKSSDSL